MRAFLNRGSESALLLYADLYIEGIFGQGPHAVDPWHAGRALARHVQRLPELRTQLQERYKSVKPSRGREMLENLFGEIGEHEDILAMVEKYIANGHPYDGRMANAIRAAALRHVPVQDGSDAYNIYPAPVSGIRKRLFALLRGKPE